MDRNVPGSHLIRQPTAATFPSRGRLDTQQIVHSCDFVQSHKFPFISEIFYETNMGSLGILIEILLMVCYTEGRREMR